MNPLGPAELADFHNAAGREWLAVNGIGGFASGSVAGANTRRYHALLVAALPPPFGRMALLSRLEERVTVQGESFWLATNQYGDGTIHPEGWHFQTEFTPWPVPTWTYRVPGDTVLVKRVYLARGKNTVYVTYSLREAPAGVTLTLFPYVAWKSYHAQMHRWPGFPTRQGLSVGGCFLQATPDAPVLRLRAPGAKWSPTGWWNERILEQRERERGLDCEEDLYCPTAADLTLRAGQTIAFTASIEEQEPEDSTLALAAIIAHRSALIAAAGDAAGDETGRDLTLASDQFVTVVEDRSTIIAGYPWFTDWGRDTMIALPGLCLTTGRTDIAREILQSFAAHVSEGMIPNRFPDAGETPDYNTVDATLWFVHACAQTVEATGDTEFQARLLPILEEIVRAHLRGTRFGIGVDPEDGLLAAGEPGVQLTWMDAKIGDWVVTPRTGKPVEINALWIEALRTLAAWKGEGADGIYTRHADRAAAAFVTKFVRPDGRGLYDLILPDGTPDAAIRPNQVIAAALPHSPLGDGEIKSVVDVASAELLTPCGLRTLAPSDPAYRPEYGGGPLERDSAYHQGTVWPWLLGPFVDAHRRAYGDEAAIRAILAPLEAHLRDYGVGGVAEVFDGDAPHRPNGCPWQAWSVAALLRSRRAAPPDPDGE